MKMRLGTIYLGLLVLILDFETASAQGSHVDDFEHRLMKDLFDGYNKDSRPVFNKSKAVNVELDVAYSQLVDLDGKNQILSSKIWIRQIWRNPFLSWKPENYSGIKAINVDPKLVWKPDLVLYNNIGIGQTGAIYNYDTKVVLNHDGTNYWYAPTEIKSICKIDITFFPFDEQKCPLVFGSWTYTGNYLNLTKKNDSADLGKYTISGEWELIAMPARRNVVKYSCCPHPYIDVTYHIIVRRKVLFYMANLILPCVVLALLTVFSFYLPPESGERVSLVITILLGLTVFMLVFTENVPRTSEVIPLIVKYSFTVLCEVSLSLLITCFVVRVYHKNPSRPMPLWYRYLTYKIMAPVLRMQSFSSVRQDKQLRKQYKERKKNSHHNSNGFVGKLLGSYSKESGCCKLELGTKSGDELDEVSSAISRNSDTLKCPSFERLGDISGSLHTILDHLSDTKRNEFNKMDWHFSARVLDAFFFWALLIVFTVSTVIFYFSIP